MKDVDPVPEPEPWVAANAADAPLVAFLRHAFVAGWARGMFDQAMCGGAVPADDDLPPGFDEWFTQNEADLLGWLDELDPGDPPVRVETIDTGGLL